MIWRELLSVEVKTLQPIRPEISNNRVAKSFILFERAA